MKTNERTIISEIKYFLLLGLLGQLVLGIIVFFYFCRKNNEVLRNMYNDNLLAAGADEIEWADVTQGLLKLF